MAEDQSGPSGPDLTQGVALAELADGGKLVGHVGDEQVLLVRRGTKVFAVGANCTHYNGPLVDGLVVDGHGAVPMASRLLRPANGRGFARAGAEPDPDMVGRAARRQDLRRRKARAAASEASRQDGRRSAGPDRDRRRRRALDSRRRKCFGASNMRARSSC